MVHFQQMNDVLPNAQPSCTDKKYVRVNKKTKIL